MEIYFLCLRRLMVLIILNSHNFTMTYYKFTIFYFKMASDVYEGLHEIRTTKVN